MGLYAKIAKVMGEIGYIPKDGVNATFKYRYATDATVYDTVRALLAREGLAVLSSMKAVTQEHLTQQTQNGPREIIHTLAEFEFTLVDGETGERHTCIWFAEAQGNDDKGVNKCATAALKYWLLKTFVIPTGDDPDGDDEPAAADKRPADPPAPKSNGKPHAGVVEPFQKPAPKDKATEKPAKHWTATPETVTKFWAYVDSEKLEHKAVLDALQVDRLEQFTGKKEDAFLAIDGLILAKSDPK